MVLGAIPAGCRRALDAGCGTGALTRRLRGVIPQVTGIDRDEQSIATARTHPQARDIGHRHEDFLTAAFEAESFRLVASMAAVHQMDAGAALARMAKRPPAGRATAASRPTSHLSSGHHRFVWPPPMTYRQPRRLAGQLLPGVRYRRHLYWRYSLTWVKPSSPPPPSARGRAGAAACRRLPGLLRRLTGGRGSIRCRG